MTWSATWNGKASEYTPEALILSSNMGEGENYTAHAVVRAIGQLTEVFGNAYLYLSASGHQSADTVEGTSVSISLRAMAPPLETPPEHVPSPSQASADAQGSPGVTPAQEAPTSPEGESTVRTIQDQLAAQQPVQVPSPIDSPPQPYPPAQPADAAQQAAPSQES